MRAGVAAVAAWIAAFGACDAAHDGAFRGTPALVLDGQLVVIGTEPPAWGDGAELTVAIQWLTTPTPGSLVSQVAEVELRFPDAVRLVVQEPPPAGAWEILPPLAGPVAIGQLVVFADLDGDGAWGPEREPLFGVSTAALVFAEAAVASARMAVPAGVSLVRVRGCRDDAGGVGGEVVPTLRLALFATARAPFAADRSAGLMALRCERDAAPWCLGIAERRAACLADPALPACVTCALGVYPEGASEAECDLWHIGCAFHAAYDPDECEAGWRACVCEGAAGGGAPCEAGAAAGGAR